MTRINVVAEGQSEMFFVKGPLNQYFAGSLCLDSRCVLTSRAARTNYEYRGGLTSYQQAKDDIVSWLKQDPSAYVTTMFDFFRLPDSFPGYQKAISCVDHLERVRILEEMMKADVDSSRFIPYIQLHEFEALLFSDIRVLKDDYLSPDETKSLDKLYAATKDIPPEDINHGSTTAPSKRLLSAVGYRKGEAPSEWLSAIGIQTIRAKCPHFSSWLNELQSLDH